MSSHGHGRGSPDESKSKPAQLASHTIASRGTIITIMIDMTLARVSVAVAWAWQGDPAEMAQEPNPDRLVTPSCRDTDNRILSTVLRAVVILRLTVESFQDGAP